VACSSKLPRKYTSRIARTSVRTAVGPTILLGSGAFFDYDDPGSSQMTLEDYAYSLAFTCRFSGHCLSRKTGRRVYYSVAQHCEIMSRVVPPGHEYAALMHESGETVCADLTTPLKSKLPDYKAIEKRCEKAIMRTFKVVVSDPALIKSFDVRLWATERRDLMNWDGKRWGADDSAEPFDFEIDPLGPYEAADSFLKRFREVAPLDVLDGSLR
jgi:hypothetical protein